MCGERWRKDCRPCLLPRDCCLSYLHVLTPSSPAVVGSEPVKRRYRLLRPRNTTRKANTPSPPLEAVVCWRRAISSLSFCLRATTETLPIPSPRAIAESTPSKSNQSASARPINSSANSAVFNQIPPLPPSIRPASPAAARYTNKLPDLPSIPSLWLP